MKKKIIALAMVASMAIGMTGCASFKRTMTDIKSNIAGGLNRTITVYTANGDVKGKLILIPMMVDMSNLIMMARDIFTTTVS